MVDIAAFTYRERALHTALWCGTIPAIRCLYAQRGRGIGCGPAKERTAGRSFNHTSKS